MAGQPWHVRLALCEVLVIMISRPQNLHTATVAEVSDVRLQRYSKMLHCETIRFECCANFAGVISTVRYAATTPRLDSFNLDPFVRNLTCDCPTASHRCPKFAGMPRDLKFDCSNNQLLRQIGHRPPRNLRETGHTALQREKKAKREPT